MKRYFTKNNLKCHAKTVMLTGFYLNKQLITTKGEYVIYGCGFFNGVRSLTRYGMVYMYALNNDMFLKGVKK